VALGGICAVLAACGDGEGGAVTSTPTGPVTVSFTVADQRLGFAQEMAAGFRFGVASVGGVTSEVRGPDMLDGPAQLRIFRELIAASQAGTSVFTLTPELFAQPLADAASKGIPLVAVDSPPTSDARVPLFVGNDNSDLGRLLADQIVALLPRGTIAGTVVIGTASPGAVVLDQRVAGLQAEFRRRAPGLTLLGPYDTTEEVDSNHEAWGALIRATPGALAFVGTGDADTVNLAAWRRQTKGRWAAGGFDLAPAALAAVKRGDIVLVSPEHYLKGAVAGRMLADRAKAGTALPQGWIQTPGLGVTRANVDEVIARQASEAARQEWFGGQVDQLADYPSLRPMPAD